MPPPPLVSFLSSIIFKRCLSWISRVHFTQSLPNLKSLFSEHLQFSLSVNLEKFGAQESKIVTALVTTCLSNGSRGMDMQVPRLTEDWDPENPSSPLPASCVKKEPEEREFPIFLFKNYVWVLLGRELRHIYKLKRNEKSSYFSK